jgi:hypothetical protein
MSTKTRSAAPSKPRYRPCCAALGGGAHRRVLPRRRALLLRHGSGGASRRAGRERERGWSGRKEFPTIRGVRPRLHRTRFPHGFSRQNAFRAAAAVRRGSCRVFDGRRRFGKRRNFLTADFAAGVDGKIHREPSRTSRTPYSKVAVAECVPGTPRMGQPRIDMDTHGFNPVVPRPVGGGEPRMDTNEHEWSAFGNDLGVAAAVRRGSFTRWLLCDLRYLLSSRRRFRAQRSFRSMPAVRPMAAARSAS